MTTLPKGRHAPFPGASMALDVLRWAWHGRSLLPLIALGTLALAIALAGVGQAAVPWLIYGGL